MSVKPIKPPTNNNILVNNVELKVESNQIKSQSNLIPQLKLEPHQNKPGIESLIDSNIETPSPIVKQISVQNIDANTIKDRQNKTIDVSVTKQDLESIKTKDYIYATAFENIPQYRIVEKNESGQIVLSDVRNPSVNPLGISLNNTLANQQVSILPSGKITNDSWNLKSRFVLFLGVEGRVTQEFIPEAKALVRLGKAQSNNTIFLNIEPTIEIC